MAHESRPKSPDVNPNPNSKRRGITIPILVIKRLKTYNCFLEALIMEGDCRFLAISQKKNVKGRNLCPQSWISPPGRPSVS